MPAFYNPYNFYPASYMQNMYPNMNYPNYPIPQQSGAAQAGPRMMEWVEGEVGAKAYQMPQGWPANSPIPLWDSTDTVIWLKSWGPMGIPNPMQKLRYEMPEGQSGAAEPPKLPDMSQYVTKQDLDSFREELRTIARTNQNGSNPAQNANRGGGK